MVNGKLILPTILLLLCPSICAWAQQADSLRFRVDSNYSSVDTLLEMAEEDLPPLDISDIFGDTVFYEDDNAWYLAEPKAQLRDASDLIDFGSRFLGVRYRAGGMSPAGFDCSGFTCYVFGHYSIKLDRRADGQAAQFPHVSRRNIQPGDLVFFAGRDGGSHIGHVGIVTQVNEDGTFLFIHSSCSRGITYSRSTETYYASRIRCFNRPCSHFSGSYGTSEMDQANPF